jgi:hypothetical protein
LKLDSAGSFISAKYFQVQPNNENVAETSFASDIVSCSDSTYLLIGKRYDPDYPFVIKLDGAFNPLWSKYFEISDWYYQHFKGIATRNGDIYFTGEISSDSYESQVLIPYVIKLTSEGAVNWTKTYEFLYDDDFYRMLMNDSYNSLTTINEINNNELLMACTVEKFNSGSGGWGATYDFEKYLLAELDTTGKTVWSKIYGNDSSYNVLHTTIPYGANSYVIGTSNSNAMNLSGPPFILQNDFHLFSIDNQGNSALNSNNITLTENYKDWTFNSLPVNSFDISVSITDTTFKFESVSLKFDSLDCIGLGFESPEISKNPFDVHPNPNDGVFYILIPEDIKSVIGIKLFDSSGRELFQQSNTPQSRKMPIDVSFLSNGIYLLGIQADKKTYFKKIVKH